MSTNASDATDDWHCTSNCIDPDFRPRYPSYERMVARKGEKNWKARRWKEDNDVYLEGWGGWWNMSVPHFSFPRRLLFSICQYMCDLWWLVFTKHSCWKLFSVLLPFGFFPFSTFFSLLLGCYIKNRKGRSTTSFLLSFRTAPLSFFCFSSLNRLDRTHPEIPRLTFARFKRHSLKFFSYSLVTHFPKSFK